MKKNKKKLRVKIWSFWIIQKHDIQTQKKTRIHWLDRRIVRKQLDIMPTNHYVQNQGKLMMQSRENGQKPQFGQFLTIWRSNISKLQIFLKNRFHSNWRLYLVLTSGQKPKKWLETFLRKISKCLILGQFGDIFANISKLRYQPAKQLLPTTPIL